MLKTDSSSPRWFLGALLLAVTLPSCGRGTPPSGSVPADTAAAGTRPRSCSCAAAPAAARAHLEREGRHGALVVVPGEGLPRCPAADHAAHARDPPHPELKLEVPVYDGTTDAVLDLAAGRIEGTALPGTTGNVGIAAHRDGFFRVLKDLKEGDALLLDTPVAAEQYRVEWIRITTPDDVSVIDPTPSPAVTLVGCYPFYHVGSAPKRFIVRAVPAEGSTSGD